MTKNRGMKKYMLCGVVLFALCLLSLRLGSVELGRQEFWRAVCDYKMTTPNGTILYSLRFPRTLACVLCGMGLSASGAVLQMVTGNKMASPALIGTSSGAGFAVIFTLSLFPMLYKYVSLFAFLGAFLATALIIAISRLAGLSKNALVLAGLSFSAILSSLISFISLLDSEALVSYNAFSIGSVSGVKINRLTLPAIMIVASLTLCMIFNKKIDILTLGDDTAASLGVNVKVLRIICLVLSSMSAAAAVSFAGLVGFAGLMSPHIARRLAEGRAKVLVPFSSLIGACLVLAADLASRMIFAPSDLPVGLVLSLAGAPFLLCLLFLSGKGADR